MMKMKEVKVEKSWDDFETLQDMLFEAEIYGKATIDGDRHTITFEGKGEEV